MPSGVYDLETRSTANLTLCGAWNYAAHPSTSILCMYLAVDDGEPERWLSGDPIPSAFLAAAEHPDDWQLIAHNHEFERAIYELVLIPRFGFPPFRSPRSTARNSSPRATPIPPSLACSRRRSDCPTARTARRLKRCGN